MVSHFLDTMSISGVILLILHIPNRKDNKGVCVCVSSSTIHPLDWVHLPLSSKFATLTSISSEKGLWKMASTLTETIGEIYVSQSGFSLELYPNVLPTPEGDSSSTFMLLWL